jgi:hypothetical protein
VETFDIPWYDEIAEVTGTAEYQNAIVSIIDPSLITEVYDDETGDWESTGDGEVYEGQARVIPIREANNRENSDRGNAAAITAIRVQIPQLAVDRMKRGMKLFVTECPSNPALLSFVFSMKSDVQGSASATRTLQFAIDGDSVPAEVP